MCMFTMIQLPQHDTCSAACMCFSYNKGPRAAPFATIAGLDFDPNKINYVHTVRLVRLFIILFTWPAVRYSVVVAGIIVMSRSEPVSVKVLT